MQEREKFSTRLGFILISAGCAIGLGNVWRFPFIVGQFGGAAFVLVYLLFLVIIGVPVMAMEFSVGRGSRRSIATSFKVLEPKGTKWHIFGFFGMAGNYLLMMFYTTVAGWMVAYLFNMAKGDLVGLSPDEVGAYFGGMLGNPGGLIFWMIVVCLVSFGVCAMGVQKGVERITKVMMVSLLLLMVVLAIRSVTLPNSGAGLNFYLMPNFANYAANGVWATTYAALSQALFTLSLGMGSMAIFGSYISKDRTLFGESINVTLLDTFVAIMAGLIIFPACFSFGVEPGAGPGLVFVTLPNIFNAMAGGQFWGSLFFLFMSFAALSTVIAVFENIVSFAIDLTGCSRQKSVAINLVAIIILSLPCALGFNVWSSFAPLGSILDLEDFLVSSNILPLGCVVYILFCTWKKGWGWDKFIEEADSGEGPKFPKFARTYVSYVLPLIIILVFIMGYKEKFFS